MRILVVFSVIFLLAPGSLSAEEAPEKKNPRLNSMAPLGGHSGSSLDFRLRGEDLRGIRAVWFDCDRLTAEVKQVKEIVLEKTKYSAKLQSPGQEVLIRATIADDAAVGAHSMRLLTEWGLSSPLTLLVSDREVVGEQSVPHHKPASAQPLDLPANLNGKIGQKGEVDYYAFNALENQELRFEVLVAGGLLAGSPIHFRDPELILYQPFTGWFESNARRLETRVESTALPLPSEGEISRPRLRHRFSKEGRYLVAVGSLSQKGGDGHTYQLRITPVTSKLQKPQGGWTYFKPAHAARFHDWQERGFTREIHSDRWQQLWSRAAGRPSGSPETAQSGKESGQPGRSPANPGFQGPSLAGFPVVFEKEPDEIVELAAAISLPVIVQGKVDAPGDVDHFRFAAKAGQKVAFEIRSGDRMAPGFSLWLEVLDSAGQTVCTNVYRTVQSNSAYWLKYLRSKTIFSFEEGGEYTLRLRDLTSRRGGAGFAYRVLVRPQVPHVGVVTLAGEDHINLIPGEARQLKVTIEREEGFDHLVALHFENLPPAVQVLPTVAQDKKSGQAKGPRGEVHRDRFFPQTQEVSLTLLADGSTPSRVLPQLVRLTARAVADGRAGRPFPVRDLYLTVVNPASPKVVSQLASGE